MAGEATFLQRQSHHVGGSYAGFDQWTPAKAFPPHLKTIVPVAAYLDPTDVSANNVAAIANTIKNSFRGFKHNDKDGNEND